MQRYLIIAAVASFAAGILELTPVQASARSHALKPLGDSLYEVTAPVQFKNGEVVGYDGEINKSLLQLITETSAEPGKLKTKKASVKAKK